MRSKQQIRNELILNNPDLYNLAVDILNGIEKGISDYIKNETEDEYRSLGVITLYISQPRFFVMFLRYHIIEAGYKVTVDYIENRYMMEVFIR